VTLVSLRQPLIWPWNGGASAGLINEATGSTLNGAGEYSAFIFRAKEAMTISHVGWRPGAVSGSPTVDVRIETVDAATGLPSGTLWAANTNIVTAGIASAASFRAEALTASASIAAGEYFAVKFAYNSGTSFAVLGVTNHTIRSGQLPYRVTNTGAAAAVNMIWSSLALGSSATDWYRLDNCFPFTDILTSSFNNTNSAARGVRFQVPFKCRCVGMLRPVGTTLGDYNVAILDDSGSELGSTSTAFDGNIVDDAGGGVGAFFDTPIELATGTWYRAVIEPTSATNTTWAYMITAGSDYEETYPAANWQRCERVSGVWTDTADDLPLIDLLFDQIDDGTGSGAAASGGMGGNFGRGMAA
jgi:hypothetical protein